jgi:LPXTG-motif cell wall-anchored protein
MSTNGQTHTDLIWSIQFDKSGAIIGIAVLAVLGLLVVVLVRRRKKA